MTPDEEENLALAVTTREIMGEAAGLAMARKVMLPADLIELLRAGITVEDIDREMECEDIQPGESAYRYVWTLPTAGGRH